MIRADNQDCEREQRLNQVLLAYVEAVQLGRAPDRSQLLTPAQLRRFKEIALQSLGALAFTEPDVAEALRLTPEQKKQIRTIQDQASFVVARIGPHGDHHKPPPRPEVARRPDPDARDKILSLLTPEQKQTWQEQIGEPFKSRNRFGPHR